MSNTSINPTQNSVGGFSQDWFPARVIVFVLDEIITALKAIAATAFKTKTIMTTAITATALKTTADLKLI